MMWSLSRPRPRSQGFWMCPKAWRDWGLSAVTLIAQLLGTGRHQLISLHGKLHQHMSSPFVNQRNHQGSFKRIVLPVHVLSADLQHSMFGNRTQRHFRTLQRRDSWNYQDQLISPMSCTLISHVIGSETWTASFLPFSSCSK